MKKGDKLRVIVSKGHPLLCNAPLRKGQIVRYFAPLTNTIIGVDTGAEVRWLINSQAVEEVEK